MAGNAAPIIVKKRKAKHHEGHHGGAWKVAYADFVTAMMAFFLLLWLLNSTTQEQRSGISNYFSNASVARTTSGAGGVLGGQTITLDGPQRGQGGKDKTEGPQPSEEDLKALMRKREEEKFKLVERAIKRTLERLPGLRKFADHLILESTEEGLRIQIIDRAKTSMFARGSSVPYQHTRQLLEVVSHAVAKLPNKVLVAGHTDATPYARGASYSNWELSADRANAARRELTRFGVPAGRFARVVGKAATQPLLADDPKNARNRRISITLLREDRPPPEVAHRQRTPVKRKATPPPPVVNGSKLQKVIPPKPEGGR